MQTRQQLIGILVPRMLTLSVFFMMLVTVFATMMVPIYAYFGLFRSIDVLDAYWSVAGRRVSIARVGEQVTAHVILYSREKFDGETVLHIRIDLALRLDKDAATLRLHILLRPREQQEYRLVFVPILSSVGYVNGYFIKIPFGLLRGSWGMPNSYPPRLLVTHA